ncbi:hypothetical protein [Nitrospira sp. Nam74]
MTCARCRGLMIVDGLLDESGFRIDGQVERCLNCGYLEDMVILSNRANSSACAVQTSPLDRFVQKGPRR